MIAKEILESVDVIPDPYIKSATYAKIGEGLARARNNLYKTAFLRAIETAREIEDPVTMFRALLSVGYSMGKAGLKSAKRIYISVMEDSRMLPDLHRDVLMGEAVRYLLALGEINEAVVYALEIKSPKLRNETLLRILHANTKTIEKEQLKAVYRLRKSRLILEYIDSEPYRSRAMIELVRTYLLMGSYENAIKSLNEVAIKDWAKQAFKEVVFYLKEKMVLGHYRDALEDVAKDLARKFGASFTVELAFVFALSGECHSALDIIRRLEDYETVLMEMALELLERDHDVLPAFISAMNDGEVAFIGKAVMNRILEKPGKGSWAIVKAIGEGTASEEIWTKIARYHVIMGDLESALKIGTFIRDERLHSLVMADVAHHLVKRGEVERAIDVALGVRDPEFSSLLISEILIKALEQELSGRVKSWNGSRR